VKQAPARRQCERAAGRRSRPTACSAHPCGSSDRRRAEPPRSAALLGLGFGARLRPRHDFHQEPADAEAGERPRATPQRRRAAASESSRSRFPSASAHSRARREWAGPAPARSASDCRDRPACRNARCARRSLRPPPGSRRGDRRWRRRRTPRPAQRLLSAPHRPPWRPRPARAARGARR